MTTPSLPPTAQQPTVTRTRVNIRYLLAGALVTALWSFDRHLPVMLADMVFYLVPTTVLAYLTSGWKRDWRTFSRHFFYLSILVGPVLMAISRYGQHAR
jgi:hypothetical protein